MIEKCEPPPELRGVDGWHWVETETLGNHLMRWLPESKCWLLHDERYWPDETRSWRYIAPCPPPAVVTALVEALERIANHPEAERELIDYGPDGKQRIWPTVRDEARAALAAYREGGR